MLNDLFIHEVIRHGGDKNIAERLLIHKSNNYLTWLVRHISNHDYVYGSLETVSQILDIPITKLRYAYFSASSTPHGDLRKLPEYELVVKTLNEIYYAPELWRSLEKYCYRQLKRLCIEELTSRNKTVMQIMDMLNARSTTVYEVRSAYLKREFKKIVNGT